MVQDHCLFDTELTADCFETASYTDERLARIVSVGTYQFFPEENRRRGLLYLFELDQDLKMIEQERIETAGILDMKWKGRVISCALSNGRLERYALEDHARLLSSVEIDSSAIAFCLDVCPQLDRTVVSMNNGRAAIVSGPDDEVEAWQAHPYDTWCCSLDRHDLHLAYTGSDDYTFKLWDTRVLVDPVSTSKHHSAGICSIVADPHREHVFATGSYDQTCAIWDRRNPRQPTRVLQAGSGVWRLRWHPTAHGRLLAACMHDGFKVWDTETGDPLAARPTDSIAYGCDWIFAPGKDEAYGGAIFYTHQAIIWSL